MKKNISYLSIVLFSMLIILLTTACSLTQTPTDKVKSFLNQYSNLSDNVLTDLDTKVASENLSSELQKVYTDVLKRQYKNIKYEIKDEKIDGDKATVITKITVYDLYKIDKDSLNYMNNNLSEFNNTNGVYDDNMFNKYRLNEMLKTDITVDYEIEFHLNKVEGEWILESPDRETLEKIHGLYNYDSE